MEKAYYELMPYGPYVMVSVLAKFRPSMGNFFLVTIFLILKKPSCLKNCPLSESAIFRLLARR